MAMYESRRALVSTDLNQGDLIGPILAPGPADEKTLVVRKGKPGQGLWDRAQPKHIESSPSELRLQHTVARMELALVLSNSCDNARGDSPLLLAPIAEFRWPSNIGPADPNKPDVEKAKERDLRLWSAVNGAATGTSNPKAFYLPANPDFGLKTRLQANLVEFFSITHAYLNQIAAQLGTKRICGLKPEAVRHLQWVFAMFIARNPSICYLNNV